MRWFRTIIVLSIVILLYIAYVHKFIHFTAVDINLNTNQAVAKIDINIDIAKHVTIPLRRSNVNKIVYLKTYKTASSTLASVFHNYAVRRNKSCIIAKSSQLWNFSKTLDQKTILRSLTLNRNRNFEMFVNHVIFNPFLFEIIANTSNQLVTILRNPIHRFLSAWNHEWGSEYYFKQFPTINSLSSFIQNASIDNNTRTYSTFKFHTSITLDSQCQQLMPTYPIYDNNTIHNILSGQWLVLITEKWEQSLLLLRYAYNLDWVDLVYLHNMNTDRKRKKGGDDRLSDLTDEELRQLNRLNHCDDTIWKYANMVFDYRIQQIYKDNQTLQNDIEHMRYVRQKEIQKCEELLNMNESSVLCQSMTLDFTRWIYWARKLLA